MSDKAQRNEAAYEQITAILTAVGRPMKLGEIHEHQMFRPLNASSRSLAQWLIHLRETGVVSKRGDGAKRATYSLAVPKERGRVVKAASDSVIISVSTGGFFRSVQAPAGVKVELEIVA